MKVTIVGETGKVIDALAALGEGMPRALARALNRTRDMAQTVAVRALADDTAYPQTEIRKSIRTGQATFDNQVATMTVTGRRIPLMSLAARQTAAGVTYRLPGGRSIVPGGFIATMRSGHRGVYVRKLPSVRRGRGAWSPNLPIVEQYGPSLPHVFETRPAVLEAVIAKTTEAFPEQLEQSIEFASLRR